MLKKLFILFSVFLIMGSCVLPAFADGVGTGQRVYSVLPFDLLLSGSQYSVTSTYTAGSGNVQSTTGTYVSTTLPGYTSYQRTYAVDDGFEIYTELEVASNSIVLYSPMMVVDMDLFDIGSWIVSAGVDEDFAFNYSVTGQIRNMRSINDQWQDTGIGFLRDSGTVPSLNNFDFGRQLSFLISEITSNRYVLIKDFRIELTMDYDDPEIPRRFVIRSKAVSTSPTVDDWLREQQLTVNTTVVVDPANPVGADLTDWLSVAVGSFLNFELWPGFSINEVLYLVLVIGILLAFFTMLI